MRLATRKVNDNLSGHFWCPGCNRNHTVRLNGDYPWAWNESHDKPTLNPSVKVDGFVEPTDEEWAKYENFGAPLPEPKPLVCHSFILEGRIEFLTDSTHDLSGQTVDLPEYPQDYLNVPS